MAYSHIRLEWLNIIYPDTTLNSNTVSVIHLESITYSSTLEHLLFLICVKAFQSYNVGSTTAVQVFLNKYLQFCLKYYIL